MEEEGEVTVVDDEFKKSQLTERLQKREEERLRSVQQRKTAKDNATVVKETGQFFDEQFTKIREDMEIRLKCSDITGSATKHFDDLVVDLQKLQKFLTDSTRFLSSYKVQQAQLRINQLKLAIEEKRRQVEPKKKFAFKSEKKRMGAQVPVTTDLVASDEKPKSSGTIEGPIHQGSAPNECGFSERCDETLRMFGENIDYKDVMLSSLTACRVELRGAPSTVHMNAMQNCTVLCGPTSGSVFIDDCSQCTFVVACHQLRVHRTTQTNFYLHVTSRAIIEDCSTVTFAPYNWSYDGLDNDFSKASLDHTRNNWNSVDDFNWLASDTPSPNWSVMEADQRVTSWAQDNTSS
jgi:hypothetical protein